VTRKMQTIVMLAIKFVAQQSAVMPTGQGDLNDDTSATPCTDTFV